MPEYAKKGRYDMLCSLPVLVDGVPMEIVEAKGDYDVIYYEITIFGDETKAKQDVICWWWDL